MDRWKKHAIGLFIGMSIAYVITRQLADNGFISGEEQMTANFVLNWSAVVYAIMLARMADELSKPFNDAAKRMGIEPATASGIMLYATERVKPVLDALEELGYTKDRIKEFIAIIPKLMDMAKTVTETPEEKPKYVAPDEDYILGDHIMVECKDGELDNEQ